MILLYNHQFHHQETHTQINNDSRYQTTRFHPRCQPHESLRLLERGKEEPRDN
jgi:hypothetical protein